SCGAQSVTWMADGASLRSSRRGPYGLACHRGRWFESRESKSRRNHKQSQAHRYLAEIRRQCPTVVLCPRGSATPVPNKTAVSPAYWTARRANTGGGVRRPLVWRPTLLSATEPLLATSSGVPARRPLWDGGTDPAGKGVVLSTSRSGARRECV